MRAPIYYFQFLKLQEVKEIFRILKHHNIEAMFVGGCVRDSILGIETNDYDIAANAGIQNLVDIFETAGIKCVKNGIRYGSVVVIIGKVKFDVTSLRCDTECFGRHCKVIETCDFETDAKRRDFTINAIYLSDSGIIHDYLNSLDDIKNKRVIFIGDPRERIKEDYLRILRYYRFAAHIQDYSNRYGCVLKEYSEFVKMLPIERVQNELFKIIKDAKIVNLMYNENILSTIFGNEHIHIEDFNKLAHLQLRMITRLYVLFSHEVLFEKFKLSKEQKRTIRAYEKFADESIKYAFYKNGQDFADEMAAIKHAKFGAQQSYPARFKIESKFPITYRDLPSGIRNAGRLLTLCEKWWFNNNCDKTKEECLQYINSLSNV